MRRVRGAGRVGGPDRDAPAAVGTGRPNEERQRDASGDGLVRVAAAGRRSALIRQPRPAASGPGCGSMRTSIEGGLASVCKTTQ